MTIPEPLVSECAFELEDRKIRDLVRDLQRAKPVVYWTDLLLTTILGWTSFAAAAMLRPFSPGTLIAFTVAVLALYRGLTFLHELTHQLARTLPRFESMWNWLVGYPLLLPSSAYVGVHQYHHGLSTYGTSRDPEYLPFAKSHLMTIFFALENLFIPVFLVIRFLVLSPIGLIVPRFQKWLVVYASSLTMNLAYRREYTAETVRTIRRHSVHMLLLWAGFLALYNAGILPGRVFLMWLAMFSLVSLLNGLRTLGAHDYESSGEQLTRREQLLDSIDTPGAAWTELWAPVGLRYHALHHYFPGLPYHNLPTAWRRIVAALPEASVYHTVSNPSLFFSLRTLLRKGRR